MSQEIVDYIDKSIPTPESTKIVLNGSQTVQTQIININSETTNKVNEIICSEINGNISFSPEEKEIDKLIEKYSCEPSEIMKLRSALYELKDSGTSKEHKRGSWQKLYGFLGKIADKVGDVGVSLLTKYIEQQMNN